MDTGLLDERIRKKQPVKQKQVAERINTVNDLTGNTSETKSDSTPQSTRQRQHVSDGPVHVDKNQPIATNQNTESVGKQAPSAENITLPEEGRPQAEPDTVILDTQSELDDEPTKLKRRSTEEQKVKLQRIKERIVIEEKIVTVHVPVHFNSMLISVISLYPRAGATFVTSNFARMLGENKVPVAVFEPVLQNIGSTYYELMHGDTNAPKEWKSWAEQIQKVGYITQKKTWLSNGVNWIPSNINATPDWNEDQTMQLLLSAKKFPVAICDISSNYNVPQCKKILSMSDEIWIVADGDPVQLNHHLQTVDALRNEFPGKQMKVIGNKWSEYIKQAEWKDAMLLPTLAQIPDLGSVVLKHAWDGNMAWDDAKLKNVLSTHFKPLARSVMAKEMYSLMKKQYGFSAKVRGFFKQMKALDDESNTKKY